MNPGAGLPIKGTGLGCISSCVIAKSRKDAERSKEMKKEMVCMQFGVPVKMVMDDDDDDDDDDRENGQHWSYCLSLSS